MRNVIDAPTDDVQSMNFGSSDGITCQRCESESIRFDGGMLVCNDCNRAMNQFRKPDMVPPAKPCGHARDDHLEGVIISCAPMHIGDGRNY